jgi:hypothetical protein
MINHILKILRPQPTIAQAAAILSRHRVQTERQRVRDKARAMNAAMGRDIPEVLR